MALAPLLDRARESERQGQAAQAIEAAQLMLTVAAREAEMRTGRAEAAVQAETEARAAWAGLIAARFGDQADPQRMRGALPDLRRCARSMPRASIWNGKFTGWRRIRRRSWRRWRLWRWLG